MNKIYTFDRNNFFKIIVCSCFLIFNSCSNNEEKVCNYVEKSIELLSKESLTQIEFNKLLELENKISIEVNKYRIKNKLNPISINYKNILQTHQCEEIYNYLNL